MKVEISVRVLVEVDDNYNSHEVKQDLMTVLWGANYDGNITGIREVGKREVVYNIINNIHRYRNVKLDNSQLDIILKDVKESSNVNRFEDAIDGNLENFGYKYNVSGNLWEVK